MDSSATPLLPLASPEGSEPWLSQRRLDRAVLAFVMLGLAARCVRYFLRFPLWEDESFLCVNLIDRDFRGLMQPLAYHQVAPLFFLWVQLAVVKVLGFHELSLRLIPFLAGLGNILLFWRLAQRCLIGAPRLLAVAVFSVTYATIRYSAEAKPYGIDLFVALVLITFMVNWLLSPGRRGWLWGLAATIPLAVGLSYGAVMLGGGLCLTIAWVIGRQRRWESLFPWAVYTGSLLASFATLYVVSIRGQEASDLEAMREMWQEHFPPLTGFGDFAYWMLHTHTGDIVAYPAGGSPFQSSLSSVCWLAALVVLARRKQDTFLVLCLTPLAVTFVAALLRRFPYGGHIRLNLYMAPLMCLLIGYGTTVLLAWLVRRGTKPIPCLGTVLVILALVGGVTVVRDLASPYKNISDERSRAFAQWFWYNAEYDSEVACLKTDLGRDFAPDTFRQLSFSAEYLCNQRIYSPRHATGEAIHWERISATHPLRCVLYRCPCYSFDEDAFEAWLNEMQETYDLVSRETYPEVRLKNTGSVLEVDYLEIYRFVPKDAPGQRPANSITRIIPPSPPSAPLRRARGLRTDQEPWDKRCSECELSFLRVCRSRYDGRGLSSRCLEFVRR
jgi:Dolichyl-phosphate-mannose-protein mannosyltransferase